MKYNGKGECFFSCIFLAEVVGGDYSLLCLLASQGGGKSSGQFALEVVKLGLEREQRLVDLLLVVSVDAGGGEGGDPGQGDQGQAVEDGPDIGQQIHAHGELE